MNRNLIIIFTRNPELGKVKTRLAKTIGKQNALDIYKLLLRHTERTIQTIDADKAVYYSIEIRAHDIWNNDNYQKHQQLGEDLGIRMLNAFKNGFKKGYEKIIIIGSDLFDLKENHINEAFKRLDKNDVVIGPALDGGYYLLGLKTLYPSIFKLMAWGTETVLNDTLRKLENETVFLLEQLNDIDTFEDLKQNPQLLQHIQKYK